MSTLEPSTEERSASGPPTQNDERMRASQARARRKTTARPVASHQHGSFVPEPELTASDREQLAALASALDWAFYAELGLVAQRARQVGREIEGLRPPREGRIVEAHRPSLVNLRRHAMRQWFDSVLEGREGELYERRLRSLYFPILVGDAGRDDVAPILVEHFLDYIEGFLTSWLLDRPHENLVPSASMLHAFQRAMAVQRRVLATGSPRS